MKRYLQFIVSNWPVLSFGFLSVFWGNFGQSFFIAWFGADIQKSLGLSAAQYGMAYSFATLCSAVTLIWAGSLIDKLDLRKYIIGVATGLSCAALVMSQVSSVILLLIGLFLLRLFGQGLLPHTGQTVMIKYFSADRGKALSISTSGVPVGEIILPLLIVWLMSLFGWQKAWLFVFVFTPALFLPLMIWLIIKMGSGKQEEKGEEQEVGIECDTVQSMTRKEVLRDKRFWLIMPAVLTPPFVVTGIFIHQPFLLEAKGWTPAWFATCFVFYGATHWIGSLFAGWLVDLFTGRRLVGLYLAPLLAGFILLTLFDSMWIGVVFMSMMGFSLGALGPVTGALWAELYGTEHMGAIRSMVISMVVFATALSPIMIGYLIDHGGSAFLLLQLICGVTFFSMILGQIGSVERKNNR